MSNVSDKALIFDVEMLVDFVVFAGGHEYEGPRNCVAAARVALEAARLATRQDGKLTPEQRDHLLFVQRGLLTWMRWLDLRRRVHVFHEYGTSSGTTSNGPFKREYRFTFTRDGGSVDVDPPVLQPGRERDLERLGLRPGATDDEVRLAHRRLVKELHPDAHPGASADKVRDLERRFAQVHEAYERLTGER